MPTRIATPTRIGIPTRIASLWETAESISSCTTNFQSWRYLYSTGYQGVGQVFLVSTAKKLTSVKFWLRKLGTPSGDMTARLYLAADGTGGKVGTGSAIASSAPIAITTLTTSGQWIEFTFSGSDQYEFPATATYYVIALEYAAADDSNYLWMGYSSDSGSPLNQAFEKPLGTWTADDDYKLLYEVFASQFIFHVGSPTRVIPGSEIPIILDSYPESNYDSDFFVTGHVGQSFSVDYPRTITSAQFYLRKHGNPTGNITVRLYAHTGAYGSTGVPNGASLATATPIDITTLTDSYQLVTFTFPTPFSATTTNYFLVISCGGTPSDHLEIAVDASSPAHLGNYTTLILILGLWNATPTIDAIFYVYGI